MMLMRGHGRTVLLGVLSLVGMVLILVGIPAGLAFFGGNPLEALPRTGEDLWWTLTSPDDGTVFIALLTIIAWVAWASVALSFIVEIPAAVRGVPAPKLPGLSWQQGRAAAMTGAVATMIALGTAGTATAAPTGPASSTASVTATSSTQAAPSTADESVVVESGDTLWGIAEDELGDGSRYPEIAQANPQVDSPDDIQPGWHLDMPSSAGAPAGSDHDSSSGQARDGGQGQGTGGQGSSQDTTRDSQDQDSASAPAAGQKGSGSSAAPSAPSSSADQARPSTHSPSSSGAPSTSPMSSASAGESSDSSIVSFAVTAGIGTLTAAGLLTLLLRLRGRQVRHRKAGRRIARPAARAAQAEAMLRETADPLGVEDLNAALRSLGRGAARGEHERPVLRAARLLPDRIEIYVVQESPELLPAPWQRTDQLEAGAATEPGTWILLRSDLPEVAGDDADDAPAPWPALVTVGFDEHDAHVLLNLEEIGSLAVTGDAQTARDVIAGLGIELITSSWCDDAQITLVGVMPELVAALDNERVVHDEDLDHVLAGIEHSAQIFREAYDQHEISDPTHARLSGRVDESWTPHLILTGQTMTPDQQQRLAAVLESRPRVAIAAVTCGTDPTGPWSLEVQPGRDGLPTAHLAPAGMTLTPQHLTEAAYRDQLDLFATTTEDDVPGPAWAESIADSAPFTLADLPRPTPTDTEAATSQITLAPVAGAGGYGPTTLSATELLTTPATTEPTSGAGSDDVGPEAGPDATDSEQTLESDATTEETPTAVATPQTVATDETEPPTSEDSQEAPEAGEGDAPEGPTGQPAAADDDLQDETVAELPVANGPVVKVLGAVEVLGAHGPRPASHRRITELVAYLTMHPGGTDTTLSAAIFPGEETGPKLSHKRQTYMNSARRWLGRAPDGHPYVAEVDDGGYRVTPEVTLDWHHMRQLVGPDIAAATDEDLHEALTLVTETPFTGIDPTRWSWAEPAMTEICATVADIAHELATRNLTSGNARIATWATTRGLLAEPVNETLWRDRITAAWATGIPGAARETITEARAALEPLGDDLEDDTIDLINDVITTDRRHA